MLYLEQCFVAIADDVKSGLEVYSKARWLWYLRRLPLWVYPNDTDVIKDGIYERNLAEALTGAAGSDETVPPPSYLGYVIDDSVIANILWLFAGVKYLAIIDWLLRNAGRGISMRLAEGAVVPEQILTSAETEAVRLYIERVYEQGGRFLTRAGSRLGELRASSTDPTAVFVIAHTKATLRDEGWDTPDGVVVDRFDAHFAPSLISLSSLANYVQNARRLPIGWPSDDFIAIASLCILMLPFSEKRPFLLSLLMFGFLSFKRDFFVEQVDSLLPEVTSSVYRCTMALLTGLLAMVLVFATLASLSRELFASGGGLFLGLAMAHVVGTTVARAMLPGSPRTARVIIHASGLALLYALLLVLATVAFYAVLAYAAPRLFGSTVGLVMAAIVAHAACAVVTRRRDSAWAQTAGPLWLAGVMLVTAYLFLVSRESAWQIPVASLRGGDPASATGGAGGTGSGRHSASTSSPDRTH